MRKVSLAKQVACRSGHGSRIAFLIPRREVAPDEEIAERGPPYSEDIELAAAVITHRTCSFGPLKH